MPLLASITDYFFFEWYPVFVGRSSMRSWCAAALVRWGRPRPGVGQGQLRPSVGLSVAASRAWTPPRRSWWTSRHRPQGTRGASRRSAPPRARGCACATPFPARRCWRGPSFFRPAWTSSPRRDRASWRCSSDAVPPASAGLLQGSAPLQGRAVTFIDELDAVGGHERRLQRRRGHLRARAAA